jgi:RNA polymerase sigma-70 factor (ECF subfamily)
MEHTFLQSIQAHQPIIYKVCKLYRDTPEDREDLFQEIVYQLWKSYPAYKGDAKMSTWIYRIALNTAMAAYRKARPGLQYLAHLPEAPDLSLPAEDTDQQQRLFAALHTLSDSEKALISLYLEDFAYAEIGAIIGISESNVGVRLNRIKNKLKQLLK